MSLRCSWLNRSMATPWDENGYGGLKEGLWKAKQLSLFYIWDHFSPVLNAVSITCFKIGTKMNCTPEISMERSPFLLKQGKKKSLIPDPVSSLQWKPLLNCPWILPEISGTYTRLHIDHLLKIRIALTTWVWTLCYHFWVDFGDSGRSTHVII
jgi:hypothetical protein